MPAPTEILRRVLLALRAMHGEPCPESILVDAVTIRFVPRPTEAEVKAGISDAESQGFISGITDPLDGRVWTLTQKGSLRAQAL